MARPPRSTARRRRRAHRRETSTLSASETVIACPASALESRPNRWVPETTLLRPLRQHRDWSPTLRHRREPAGEATKSGPAADDPLDVGACRNSAGRIVEVLNLQQCRAVVPGRVGRSVTTLSRAADRRRQPGQGWAVLRRAGGSWPRNRTALVPVDQVHLVDQRVSTPSNDAMTHAGVCSSAPWRRLAR